MKRRDALSGLLIVCAAPRSFAQAARKATVAFAAGVSLLAVACVIVVICADVGVRLAQRMLSQA